MEIIFSEFRDAFLSFFGRLGIGFSGFLGLENKFENETSFSEKRILRSGTGWVSRGGIWAL